MSIFAGPCHSVVEGLASWQTSVREFLNFQNKQDHPKYTVNLKPNTFHKKQKEVAINLPPKIEKYYLYKIALVNGGKTEGIKLIDKGESYQIFSRDGIVTVINKNQIKNIDKIELLGTPRFETKFTYKGGTILVPVTISNKGRKEYIKLILDTGCGTTQIHPDVVKRLKIETKYRGKSFIADGRKIDSFFGTVDSIEVWPFKEENFTISTNYIADKHGIDGLLGMNFLNRHPFDIDATRQVIIWK